ncbi:MAG: hypothetical protein NUV52_04060 [Candidatus Roizmanbacteria bacterium]|nr:hypothetical protein [Candidatus Roizmanbacteria bacterium]
MKRLLYICLLWVIMFGLLSHSVAPTYGFSLGLNVAGRVQDFDRSVAAVGPGGWVSVMGEPNGQTLGYITSAQNKGVRVILRVAHAPNGPPIGASYADEWVSFFEANKATITAPVYLMPLNEPNNAQEKIDARSAKSYLERLESQLAAKNLRPSPVFLLTPALDSYQLSGKLSTAYIPLGGSELFNKFDGIALHLYGRMNCAAGTVAEAADQYMRGDWRSIIADLALTGSKPIVIPETGIVCNEDGRVHYPYTEPYAQAFATYLQYAQTTQAWNDPRIQAATILIYDPEKFSEPSWLDQTALISQYFGPYLSASSLLVSGTGTSGLIPGQTASTGITNNYIIGANADRLLGDAYKLQPWHVENQYEICRENDTACTGKKIARGSGHLATAKVPKIIEDKRVAAESEQSILAVITNEVSSWFGRLIPWVGNNASDRESGYANTFKPKYIQDNETGGGAEAGYDQTEVEGTHTRIAQLLLPYAANRNVVAQPGQGGQLQAAPTPVENAGIPFAGPTYVPGGSPAEYASLLREQIGNSTVGWRVRPTWTNAVYSGAGGTVTGLLSSVQRNAYDLLYASTTPSSKKWKTLQCVGYVAAVETVVNGSFEQRDAMDYCLDDAPPTGFARSTYDSKLSAAQVEINDLVVWTADPYGHIAMVTDKQFDQESGLWTMELHDANAGIIGGTVQKRYYNPALPVSQGGISCYLRRL